MSMNVLLTDVAIVVAIAVLVGFYVSWRATRLDRLNARAEAARAALDAALARRSGVALEFAASGLLDPATSVLIAGAAHDARAAGQLESVAATGGEAQPRELAESALSRVLRAAFTQPRFRESLTGKGGADELLDEIDRKSTRLNSSHPSISYAVFCLKKKKKYYYFLLSTKKKKKKKIKSC